MSPKRLTDRRRRWAASALRRDRAALRRDRAEFRRLEDAIRQYLNGEVS